MPNQHPRAHLPDTITVNRVTLYTFSCANSSRIHYVKDEPTLIGRFEKTHKKSPGT